ncbi:MAG: Coenzyme F420 hydrogenase/dehydrogenase, beta subunit C-terminal domain [Clostridia bacterium]
MIKIEDKSKCCACTACASACPKKCISMEADSEGFSYPIVDTENCIDCRFCEKVCPIATPKVENPFEQEVCIVQNKNQKVLKESTSGGAFTEIAKYVLSQNGVAFGASYHNEFKVKHIYVDNEEDLKLFRNSKYSQSELGDSYIKVQEFLMAGRWVCFSGTPCQVEGLNSFLGKDYPNLIKVDIVCHAVPSPLIFKKYIESKNDLIEQGVSNILFRDKHYGYKYSTMTLINNDNKKVYHRGIDSDPMLRAFFTNICDRPSCYDCSFKKRYRVSDFTMWDCFSIYDYSKELDNDKGVTNLLMHSPKARGIFAEIKDYFNYVKVDDVVKIVNTAKEMHHSVPMNSKREAFFKDANSLNGKDLMNKYFPDNAKTKVKRFVRITCFNLGIYSFVKKIARKILGKR